MKNKRVIDRNEHWSSDSVLMDTASHNLVDLWCVPKTKTLELVQRGKLQKGERRGGGGLGGGGRSSRREGKGSKGLCCDQVSPHQVWPNPKTKFGQDQVWPNHCVVVVVLLLLWCCCCCGVVVVVCCCCCGVVVVVFLLPKPQNPKEPKP